MSEIDRNLIPTPNIQVSKEALMQIAVIKENDLTLQGPDFRIAISGKGCNGFNYKTFFDKKNKDDFSVTSSNGVRIILDPFSAFYLQEATLEYYQDFEKNIEGFQVTNLNQSKFEKKFWKLNKEMIPPTK